MYICLGANVIRFLIISCLSNPWLILPLQVVQGMVLATVWATATSYVSLVSPPHLKGTTQQILQILYHGVGRGLGAMVGGVIITNLGARALFAIIALLTACVLGAIYGTNRMLKFDGIKYGHDFDDDDLTFGNGFSVIYLSLTINNEKQLQFHKAYQQVIQKAKLLLHSTRHLSSMLITVQ